jgi:hypothetical protein
MPSLQGQGGNGDRAHAAGVLIHHQDAQRVRGRLHLHKALEWNAAGEQVLVGGGSEAQSQRLSLDLRATAAAMGCEVVYAVVPAQGTLEDLAEALEKGRRKYKTERRKRLAGNDPYGFLKALDTVIALTQWHTGRSGSAR